MKSRSTLLDQLANLTKSFGDERFIVAVVGSSSPLNMELGGKYSDVDLVVIDEGGTSHNAFLEQLHLEIGCDWSVVQTWGVVSPTWLGGPAVHVHSAVADLYSGSSSLFRRSVAKYPSLSGRSLRTYAPKVPISTDELLNDRLGVCSLLDRLNRFRPSGFALEVDEPETYSSLLDTSIYCVLHSARNTLRWLDKYQEFSRLDALPAMWGAVGASNIDTLERFVRWKYARRNGNASSQDEETTVALEAQDFLAGLARWILEVQSQHRSKKTTLAGL